MACCAFAVFVLMQVAAPFVWLWERITGPRSVRANVAVTWALGSAAAIPARRLPAVSWPAGLLVVVAIEVVLIVAVQQSMTVHIADGDWAWAEALRDSWCRASARS